MSDTQPRSTSAREWMGVIIVRAAAWLRVAQFVLWLWPTIAGLRDHSLVIPVGFVLLAAWTSGLFYLALRAKRMTGPLLAADVLAAVIAALVISPAYPLGQAASTHNGLISPLCGTAVTVAALATPAGAIAGVGLVTAAWVAGTWQDLHTASAPVIYSNAIVIVVFAAVARVLGRVLAEAARRIDTATDRALDAEQREATAEARHTERLRQHRRLHDTVLHTLEHISRGTWDVDSGQAIRNCERDATYLRSLITGIDVDVPSDLGTALAAMVRDHSSQDTLRVNQNMYALPGQIPAEVIDAIVGAAGEALNNVAKYARVGQVWLTAYGDGQGGVIVKVADQGIGFDPAAQHSGWGLPWSMRDRIREIGGTITIDSAPGEGTRVEMTWKP